MRVAGFAVLGLLAASGAARAQSNPQAEAQALELLKRGIAFRTVAGPGNQTFDYATYLKSTLVAGGFAAEDVRVEKLGDTAYLVARYRGTAKNGAKPILVSGHMDVVEAKPADWERDPFTPVIENGYLFGRGASDMKYDLSTFLSTLSQLKREGYMPGRDIVVLLSGDEETAMKTTAALANQYHEAELLLNLDGGGGELDENGKPVIFGVEGAEKTYGDYELSVTNPGGHSSAPRTPNAIYQLAHALERLETYQFPGQVNDVTKASWEASAAQAKDPKIAGAMRRFAANPNDLEARAVLRADPGLIGQTGTTCVATMVTAGHASNALPQRAAATVNCRIFPGTSVEQVQATLTQIVADPEVKVRYVDTGTVASDASPVRADLMQLVRRAVHARFKGVPVVPVMAAGASDSMWFRAKGVPSYGISPIFMKSSDSFSHGLNERTPLSEIAPSIVYYKTVVTGLAK
ncbi:M20/M25/M40 family metallo-hydrolase [Sphingomonas xinjiangensis]|uniref:Acetylornithine deacetylase/succinyl-diaminopimelate desuccinylase-like protein n=1 Tax=Sphingomonas xinjiangensis TaxID=643568 RepID=A0A840YHL4_9SPHN|nr:M20/M25/M40 family metallo-hydrolase [Sphingomonas xinjiangensis]MBB5711499.1 acetylornithine deacetylase/succinyl-diaminopimelate desuccinylase-like protein [Sphingomonas xinjiangensis]